MSLQYFTDAGSGLDTNSGSSEGAAKETGVGAATTDSSVVVDLSADAPVDLSDVTINVDTIRLAGRTDGIRSTDIFLITAKDDGADTVDVSPTPSSTTSGVTWAIGGAWLTLAKPLLVVEAGDKTWVKGGTSYGEANSISQDGTNIAAIVFVGYTTTIDDGGIATNDGTDSLATGLATSSGNKYYVWKNIQWRQFTGSGVGLGTSSNHNIFYRCRADNNGDRGFLAGSNCVFVQCFADVNVNNGIEVFGVTPILFCVCSDNLGDGLSMANGGFVYSCVFRSNGLDAIDINGVLNVVVNCTMDGDGDDSDNAVRFSTTASHEHVIINTILYDCATGLTGPSTHGERIISLFNLNNANTTPYSAGMGTDEGEVTAAPDFIDEAAGDYGLQNGSPARSAGYGLKDNPWGLTFSGRDRDIGAIMAANVGGGAGANKILTGGGL